MRKLTCLFALGFLLFNNTLRANEPEKVTSTEEVSETTAKKERIKQVTKDDDYEKFRFGGYGEMVAKFMNYGTNRFYGGVDNSDHRNTIAIPRFVLAFDYKFNSKWILGAEIEFEAGGVGLETELENSENGEYETEMEKGGEVALEQFHITRLIHSAFNIRAGHLIVPMGLTNAHHEPINFFGTSRPEGETTIIPSTWHETGLEFFGSFGKGYARFDYQAMIVAGLNADGFGRDLRQRERQQRIDRAEHNAQQDRVCGHAAQELLRVRHAALLGRFQHQDQHCKDVEKRHTAQNHERGHAGAAVNVLDERHAQHGGAAAVARLHELAHQRLVLQKTFSPRPDGQDADEGGGKAEQHKPGPEVVQDVHAAHVQKQHERQSHLKGQPVRRLAERGRQKAELPQRVPHHHDKEHRQGRVQAEN